MTTKSKHDRVPARIYTGAHIPLRVIRSYAQDVARRFRPDRIILFGSYAYGTPHESSDVDLLVVMRCRNELDQAAKISFELPAPFPCDLLVRKPTEIDSRVKDRESFTMEIVSKGKVLYEKSNASLGTKGRG